MGHYGDIIASASHYQVRLLEFRRVAASPRVADFLEIEPGDEIVRIRRLRHHQKEPFSLITNYLPLDVGLRLNPGDLNHYPLMKLLEERLGLDIRKGTQLMEAALVTPEQAELLKLALGQPVFLLTVTILLGDGRPIDLTEFVLRGDVFRYRVDLVRLRGVDKNSSHELPPAGTWLAFGKKTPNDLPEIGKSSRKNQGKG